MSVAATAPTTISHAAQNVTISYPALYYDPKAVKNLPRGWYAWKEGQTEGPQQRAIEHALRACPEAGGLPVFAEEYASSGSRRYAPMSARQFFHRAYNLPSKQGGVKRRARHHYEVLRGPVRLYVDVDVEQASCITLEQRAVFVELLKGFATYACEELQRLWGIAVRPKQDVVCLEAPGDHKISYHLVFNSPGIRFATVQDAGRFVHHLALSSGDRFVWPPKDHNNDNNNTEGGRRFVCDLDVYTPNRCFRLYGSSKCKSPDRPLRPCPTWHPKAPALPALSSALFYRSLIAYVPEPHNNYVPGLTKLLRCTWATIEGAAPTSAFVSEKALTGNNKASVANTFRVTLPSDVLYHLDVLAEALAENIEALFPDVEGMLRFKGYMDELGCLTWACVNPNPVEGAYCEIQGRCHRSNNTYFVAWLDSNSFYQGCHDSDCIEQSVGRRMAAQANSTTAGARPPTKDEVHDAIKAGARARGHIHSFYEGLWGAIATFRRAEKERLEREIAEDEALFDVPTDIDDAPINPPVKRQRISPSSSPPHVTPLPPFL